MSNDRVDIVYSVASRGSPDEMPGAAATHSSWFDRLVDSNVGSLAPRERGTRVTQGWASAGVVLLLVVVAVSLVAGMVFVSARQKVGSPVYGPALPELRPSAGVVDTFARQPSKVSLGVADSGQRWTAVTGTWARGNGLGYLARPSSSGISVAVIEMGASDGLVQATQATAGASAGLAFRYVDNSNYWWIESRPESGTWLLEKLVDGKDTVIGDIGPTRTDAGTTLSVLLRGSTIEVLVDGIRRRTVVDADLERATKAGFAGRGLAATQTRWARFIASPLGEI
jgi:hypothetical protein